MIYRIGSEFTGMSAIALLVVVVADVKRGLGSMEGWPRVASKDLQARRKEGPSRPVQL
jgi:hypothetical protein